MSLKQRRTPRERKGEKEKSGKQISSGKTEWPAPNTSWVLSQLSCPTLCDPRDCTPPGSSVYGVLQARILEWVAMPFSRRSSPPRDPTQVSALQTDALPSEPPGLVTEVNALGIQ